MEDIDYEDEMLDLWLLQAAKEDELNGKKKNGNGTMWVAIILLLIIALWR